MGLFQRLTHDLRAGWAMLRQGTAQVANRAMEETELLRVRLDLRKLDEQIRELYGDIGERAVELFERGNAVEHVLADTEIGKMMQRVQTLRLQRKQLEDEMEAVRSDL
ncbi:MAG: hypothetical protein ACT4OO_10370 [Nitrospiraceae bacterium]